MNHESRELTSFVLTDLSKPDAENSGGMLSDIFGMQQRTIPLAYNLL